MKRITLYILFIIRSLTLVAQPTDHVAYYKFSGNPNDDSVNGNNGVENGTVAYGSDRFNTPNSALSLNGSSVSNYVKVNNFKNAPSTEFTVSIWIKTSATNEGTPFSYSNGLGGNDNSILMIDYTNFDYYVAGSLDSQTGISANDGIWHLLTFTWESADGTAKIFKDTKQVYSTTLSQGSSIIGDGILILGQDQDSPGGGFQLGQAFNGLMDDIRVYDRVLSVSEIQALFYENGYSLPFITTWQTTTSSESITIPTTGSGYNYEVDWGDGTVVTGYTGNASHTYATAGTHTLAISGDFPRIYFNNGAEGQQKTKIKSIEQWGDIAWTSMANAFYGCTSIVYNATDAPDLSMVTDLSVAFASMSFNADLSNWDVSTIQNMTYTFGFGSFTGNISNWDVSNVTDMTGMFQASSFNGDVSQWDVSSVQVFNSIFASATSFSGDLSKWDVTAANHLIDMFSNAISFNSDLSGWDVSGVGNFAALFLGASSFDQDLGSWDISGATGMVGMFQNAGLSSKNYDATLQGWARLDPGETQIPSNLTLGADGLKFCATAARQRLIDDYNWTFVADNFGCSGLVAYYPFSGNANDQTTNNINGTVSGAVLTTDRFGEANSAYYFNGNQNIITGSSNALKVSTKLTLSAWVFQESSGGHIAVQGTSLDPTGYWEWQPTRLSSNNIGTASSTKVTSQSLSNRWVHVVVTFNSGSTRFYYDGVLSEEVTASFSSFSSVSAGLKIGERSNGSGGDFVGKIDDFKLFNRVLTAEEINDLFYERGYSPPAEIAISDVDGNIYGAVAIGTQVWLKQNLAVTKYNNGTAIPNITDNSEWSNDTMGAYAWFANDYPTYGSIFGALYNWYIVDISGNGGKNVCPTSWHVPTDAEWTTLTDFLGGAAGAADQLKESGTSRWTAPNTGATDRFGFKALPGGNRNSGSGNFYLQGDQGNWWSTTPHGNIYAWGRAMSYSSSDVSAPGLSKRNLGTSIRCVRDAAAKTATNINSFTLPSVGTVSVDDVNHRITITGLSSLTGTPTITLSDGATISPASGIAQDFSSPVTYTVTAEDRVSIQDWTVYASTAPDLVAFYPFNGNADDESGNGNDGTINGGVSVTNDRFGNTNSAYSFDGVDGHIEIPRSIQDDFTINFWMKSSQNEFFENEWFNGGGLVDADVPNIKNDFGISLGLGKVLFGIRDFGKTIKSASLYDDNQWHMVTGLRVKATGAFDLYVDGQKQSGATGTTSSLSDPTSIFLGALRTLEKYYRGSFDDLVMYSRALDATQIIELYTENNWGTPVIHSIHQHAAVPGQQIRIYGKHFDEPNVKVLFGNIEVVPDDVSRDVAYVTVPDMSFGPLEIKVTNDFGTSKGISFTVIRTDHGGYFTNEKVISSNAQGAQSVFALDMDKDGDMDLVSVSSTDNKLAWYQNDGTQNFIENAIASTMTAPNIVFSIDVNGDGFNDIISGSEAGAAWYENNGAQGFTEHIISTLAYRVFSVHAGDLDGDGDIDILSGDDGADYIVWYKNDGNENFTEIIISTRSDGIDTIFGLNMDDIDKDGDMDIIFGSAWTDKVGYFENDGNQNFTQRFIGNSDFSQFVYPVDIDQDGDIDVLNAAYFDHQIIWYDNNGDGTFTEKILSSTISGAEEVTAMDMDGDGDIDILGTSRFNGEITLFVNDGSNNFSEQSITTNAPSCMSVYTADMDSDGDMDIVSLSSGDNKIIWFENQSFDEYGLIAYYPFNGNANDESGNGNDGTGNGDVTLAADRFGDADRAYLFDGNFDYINIGNSTDFNFTNNFTVGVWLKSTSLGNLNTLVRKGQYSWSLEIRTIQNAQLGADGISAQALGVTSMANDKWHHVIGTYDGSTISIYVDGKLDDSKPASGNSVVNSTEVWIGGNSQDDNRWFNGTMDDVRLYNRALPANEILALYMQEAAIPKIISFTPSSGAIGVPVTITGVNFDPVPGNNIVYFGLVQATVTAASQTELTVTVPPSASYEPISVLAHGLMALSREPFQVTWQGDDGISLNSYVKHATSFGSSLAGNEVSGHTSGDFDGDGKIDILTNDLNQATVYRNNSTATGEISFEDAVSFTAGGNPGHMGVADLNADGKLDIAVPNFTSNTVSILINNSSGPGNISFEAKVDINVGANPTHVGIGDFDLDGKLDLIVPNFGAATVYVLRNTYPGSGTIMFENAATLSTLSNPFYTSVTDLDNDGKSEIVLGYRDQTVAFVSIYQNLSVGIGSFEFALKEDFATGNRSWATDVADFDQDGRIDVVSSNWTSNTLSVLENLSADPDLINFNSQISFSTGSRPKGVATGDLDGDGKVDIVQSINNSIKLSLRRNVSTSAGSLAFEPQVQLSSSGAWVDVADLDGDGKLDLIAPTTVYRRKLSEKEIFAFSFAEQTGAATIGSGTIAIEVAAEIDLSNLVASFSMSTGATAKVGGVTQESGTTSNDFSSPVTYTITAEDGSTTQDLIVTVSVAPSTATSFTAFSFAQQTGSAVLGAGTIDIEVANGTDPTSLAATFMLSSGASAKVGATAQVSGVTINNFGTPITYTVTAEDGITEQNWLVTVTVANSTPTNISLTSVSVNENLAIGSAVGTLSTTDADLLDSHTYSLVAGIGNSDNSSFAVSGSELRTANVFDFESKSSYSIRMQTQDSGGEIFQKTFTIAVANVNEAPVLSSVGAKATNELVSLSFTATGTDPDLQPLTYSLDQASIDKGMTISASTGAFSWTPTESQDGSHEVIVTVSDGALSDTEVVTITVAEVNVAPVLSSIGPKSTDELIAFGFTATATDADLLAQALTFSIDQTSIDKGMTIDGVTGAFSWTPTEVQDGSHEVTVTVSDGALTASELVTITVGEINTAPVLEAIGSKSVTAAEELIFTATASDTDLPAQSLSFSLDQGSLDKGMTIDASTGVFSWVPEAGQVGAVEAIVSVSDGVVTASETISITVSEAVVENTAPVLSTIGTQSTTTLLVLTFTAQATDAEQDVLVYSIDQGSIEKGMSIDGATGVFTWTPSDTQAGLHEAVVTVSDGVLSGSQTVVIVVNQTSDSNVAPILAAIGAKSVTVLATLSFTVSGSDSDVPAQTLSYKLDQPSVNKGMSLNGLTGLFSWTPISSQVGEHSVEVTVSDGALSDTETVLITVSDGSVNTAPQLNPIADQTVAELVELTFTASATDGDVPPQPLSFSIGPLSVAKGMTIDATTGVFKWTPTSLRVGTHNVLLTVSDGELSDTDTVRITVTSETNQAPVFTAIADKTVGVGRELSFLIRASDSDLPAQELSYSLDLASTGKGMTIGESTGVFSWTPTGVHEGTHDVIASVSDGFAQVEEEFTITVGQVNASTLTLSITGHSPVHNGTETQALKAKVTGGTMPYTVNFRHRKMLESAVEEEVLTEEGPAGEFSFEIGGQMLDELGVVFEIEVQDSDGTTATEFREIARGFSNSESPEVPFARFGGGVGDWNLFTIPYELEITSVTSIFQDLGGLRFEYDWRIVRYNSISQKYANFNTGNVKVGEAYWFNAREEVAINVGAGKANTTIPFRKTLDKGWNLVGNPFTVSISWNQVLENNPDVTIVSTILEYNGSALVEGDVLNKFEGGFVFSEESSWVDIDPIASKPNGRTLAGAGKIESTDIDDLFWLIPLQLSDGQTTTALGGVGMHPDALELKDKFDGMAPPRFIDYSEMYTKHEDYFYPYFSTDVVPTKGDHTWSFTLSSNKTAGPTNLTWDMGALQNKASSLYLLDQQSGKLVDMKTTGSHTVDLSKGDFKFEIYFAASGNDVIPGKLLLGNAYPNPARTFTTIPMLLPGERNTPVDIDLSVFDINGNRIATLASGKFKPGVYEFNWDISGSQGKAVSGLYIYRLTFNDNSRATVYKKLVLR